ncbi:transposase [Caldanaerobacter subterraneus]|nr:transposase [Thermoanaerobacter siderophilus]
MIRIKEEGHVLQYSILIFVGINEDGYREILGLMT